MCAPEWIGRSAELTTHDDRTLGRYIRNLFIAKQGPLCDECVRVYIKLFALERIII